MKNKYELTQADMERIWEEVEQYNMEVYGGEMLTAQKSRYKEVLIDRELFYKRQWVHEELQSKHGEQRQ